MPGSAFDGSGPPDGDYARYLERLSAEDETRLAAGVPASEAATSTHRKARRRDADGTASASADHRWGHAPSEGDADERGSGLDACPGPARGFGFASGRSSRVGSDPAVTPATGSAAGRPPVGESPSRPRRALHALALALIVVGVASIGLAALPPEPWFSTPLPGFFLLVAGLHLRSVARRGRSRRNPDPWKRT